MASRRVDNGKRAAGNATGLSPESKTMKHDDDLSDGDVLDERTALLIERVATKAAEQAAGKAAMLAAELAAEAAVAKIMSQVCDQAVAAACAKVDAKLDPALKSFQQKLAEFEGKLSSACKPSTQQTVDGGMRRPISTPPMRMGGPKYDRDDVKVKLLGFPRDTRKEIAEGAIQPQLQEIDGFVEAFMPGRKNDFMFVKFRSENDRKNFLKTIHGDELKITFNESPIKVLRCRTREEADRTRHIDKLKRAVCEAISLVHPDVDDQKLREHVITGMNNGGVMWIGDVRVAEMVGNRGNGVFKIYADMMSQEAAKLGWKIDGVKIEAAYAASMAE